METPRDESFPAPESAVASTSRNLLQVLAQHRWLVVLGAVVGLVGGLLSYAQRQPIYQSNASVLVVKKRSDALQVAGGDPRMGFYEDYVATHLILIKSPIVIGHAVKKKELGTLKSFERMGDPTGAIIGGLIAGRDSTKEGSAPNNIINLTYKGTQPEDTGLVLAAVISSYRDFLDETYRGVSENTLALITGARNILEKDLSRKEESYRAFRANNPLLWKGSDGANIHLSRIKEFQVKQTGLFARGEELRERLKAIDKAKKSGSSTSTLLALATRPLERDGKDASLERDLESQLFPLLLREKALLQDYGDDHPEVIRVREQVAMTKQLYERLDSVNKKQSDPSSDAAVKRMEARLESQVEALRQELALLDTANVAIGNLMKDEEGKARRLESTEMKDEDYRNDIARTSKVLDQTLKRLEEINLIQDSGGFATQVISEPSGGVKVSPIAWQVIFSGLMLGLLGGVGLAYLLDLADKSFRTPEEIRKRLRLPIVGHIPYLAQANDPIPVTDAQGQPLLIDASLCAFHRPNSVDAEAYRSVRTALYFSTQGERHKVIQVTSPNMSDGKTTLIANLAVTIAQSGRRVILVDADLRRPRAHRIFGLTAKAGLAQLIAEDAEMPDVVQPTVVPNLWVLPAGPRPAAPGELLTQQRLAEILDVLRDQYDYVLVDTPPLLAVSDPCAVAPRVDGVLLTIRVSKNGRPSAERARDMLAGLRVQVFGVVVNGIGKQGAMSGYGYEHYDYAYSYSADYSSAEGDEAGAAEPRTK
jgi:polysaccharide biosynthesis transport protein